MTAPARFLLLPTGTWTQVSSADPTLLSDGTILLQPFETNPARRMRVLRGGTWCALSETELAHVLDYAD